MTALVRENPNHALQFEIQRNGSAQSVSVTPMGEKATVDGKPAEIGKIGISAQNQTILQTNEPLKAPLLGAQATWGWTELTVVGIYKIITGDISRKNIGGPLTIAKTAGDAAEQGTSSLVFLMAMLSINLGVLNLLPIPILDGGHLLFFFIEAIRRKPLEDRQRELETDVPGDVVDVHDVADVERGHVDVATGVDQTWAVFMEDRGGHLGRPGCHGQNLQP